MNNSTMRWLTRMAMPMVAVLAACTGAKAQCDITWPGNPNAVPITLVADQVTGMTQLNFGVTNAFGVTSPICGPVVSDDMVRFYTNAAKSSFYDIGPYVLPSVVAPSGSKVEFDCSEVTGLFSSHSIWVAVNDGSLPFNFTGTESSAVPLSVKVLDVTAPEIKSPVPGGNVNETTGSFFPGNCLATLTTSIAVSFTAKTTHPMFPLLSAGEYTDNCNVTITYNIDYPAGTLTDIVGAFGNDAGVNSFPICVSTVTYYATDASGNVSSVSFTVTVTDDEMPSILCPADLTVQTSDDGLGNCTWISSGLGLTPDVNYPAVFPATYSDNCSVDFYEFTSTGVFAYTNVMGDANGFAFYKGVNNITYTVYDEASPANSASCSFNLTVQDDEPPLFTFCPADVTVETLDNPYGPPSCQYTIPNTAWDATANDNCAGVLFPTNNLNFGSSIAGQALPVGLTTVTWTVSDPDLNPAVPCVQNITVIDTFAPQVLYTFPTSYAVNTTPGDCSATVTIERPNIGLLCFIPIFDNYTVADCALANFAPTEGPAVVNGTPDPLFLNAVQALDVCDPLTKFVAIQFPVGTTRIPYTWCDVYGNCTTITLTIVVTDDQDPNAVCKTSPIPLVLDNTGVINVTPAMVDNGSTDNCGPVTLSVSPLSYNCNNAINMPAPADVTLTVTDLGGNTDMCTAMVTVVDNQQPQVLCLSNTTLSASVGTCQGSAVGLGLTNKGTGPITNPGDYRDNCSTTISFTLSGATTQASTPGNVPNGTLFNLGATTVTYTIKDASNNTVVCSFVVTVQDLSGPNINPALNVYAGNAPIPNGGTITRPTINNGCLAQVNWIPPTATDVCPGAVTLTASHLPNSFFILGPTQVTYTATDASGNSSTYTFFVQINDVQLPVAKCRPDTVFLNAMGVGQTNSDSIDNGSTDNCFFSLNLVGDSTYDCTNLGTNIITLKVTDGAGNMKTCNAQVTVLDKIKPVANCIPSYTLNLPPDGDTLLSAVNFNNGSTDNTNPSMPSCPLAYSISEDYFSCNEDLSLFVGVNVVTLTVTDAAGNTNTCNVSVTVADVTAPEFDLPADTVINCTDDPNDLMLTGVPSAISDACDADPQVSHLDFFSFGCGQSKTIFRLWSVTDTSGNVASGFQTITVQDTFVPVFNMVSSYNLETSFQDTCGERLIIHVTADSLSDQCDIFSAFSANVGYSIDFEPVGNVDFYDIPSTLGTTMNQIFPIGTSEITFFAEDDCGNLATHTITVTVDDAQPPIINEPFAFFFPFNNTQFICDSVFVIPNSTGNCGNNFAWHRPFLNDLSFEDCSPYTVTEVISNSTVQAAVNASAPFNYVNPPIFSIHPTVFFPVGVTTITYTATDSEGNAAVCSFTVEIEDTEAPSLTCPPNQIFSATCPTAQVQNYINLVQVSDNCPNAVNVVQTPMPGTTLQALFGPAPVAGQQFVVTMIGTELYNADTCSFTVTLADGQAPIPTIAVLPDLVDSCGVLIVDAPSALDPCNPAADTIYATPSTPVGTFIPGTPPMYNLLPGNYVITWVYNDGNGNISTQPQNITVLNDVFPPTALCVPDITVNLLPSGDVLILPNQLDAGSFDPNGCGPLTLTTVPNVLDCDNLADTSGSPVVLKVADLKGNIATCTTLVTVKDVTAPILSPIPANTTLAACANIPAPANITAADACDDVVQINYVQDTTAFVNIYKYTIRRRWTAIDDSGNSSMGTQIINIVDAQAPVFATSTPDTITVITDANNLNCFDTVAINIKPFISDCDSTTLMITNSRTAQGAEYSEMLSKGTYTLSFTAKDGNNNISTHTITLIVKDGTNPIAACINGISVSLQSSGTVTVTTLNINANSSDNCTPMNMLDLKIQRLNPLGPVTNMITFGCGDADAVTQHPVKLIVKDQSGNMSMCETYVVVQDNVFPTITLCPPNKTVACDTDLSPTALGTATATDNCPNVQVTFADTIVDGSGQACTAIDRTWKASDLSGNVVSCVQIINLLDTVNPVLTLLPANDTIDCGTPLPAIANVSATDNCTGIVDVQFTLDTINMGSGACGKYSYTQTRTWVATDSCGNETVHTQFIVVQDTTPPSFDNMPDTIEVFSADFPPNQNCTVPVEFDAEQYFADCSTIDEISILIGGAPVSSDTLDIGGNYPVGDHKIFFTVTDACGNVGKDSVLVKAIDNSIPTVVCNDNIVVALGTNGEAIISPNDVDLGSTDNCDIDSMFLSDSLFDCTNLGANSVTLTVVDVNGNSNFCTVTVNVTLGVNVGFSLTTSSTPESYFGADDGTANAVATGGSGQFSYTWSSGQTTSSVSGLSAGTYTVTVVDTVGGCLQVDTVTIAAGAKITLSVGDADGCQNQTVSIPVTASNFFDVASFLFTITVNDGAVGTVLGITNGSINAAIINGFTSLLSNDTLQVTWEDDVLTLPNGTVLFNVDVLLGTAPVGSTSPVAIASTQFMQDSSGVDVLTGMVAVEDGLAEIVCNVPDFEVGGDIKTWNSPVKPVKNVNVSLTGTFTASQTTGPAGTYLFPLTTGANTTVKCSKNTPGLAGISGLDVLLVKRHALGLQPFTSPYQFVAADVSGEGNVSVLDALRIQQVAIGLQTHIQMSPDWKFVPKSYVFPPLPNPLSVSFPDSISHTAVDSSFLDDDFVAVRMGDVNGNIDTSDFLLNIDVDDRSETFLFRLDERSFSAGEIISVPFKASNFTDRSGYQMTLNFDPNVFELEEIEPGVLPEMGDANFGPMRVKEGKLTTLWVTAEPLTFAEGEVLFTLHFKTLRSGASLAEVLRPGSDIIHAEGYDRDGNTMKIDFEFVQPQSGQEASVFALYQNQPNPFNEMTTIGFRLPEAGRAALRVFNASGQLVKAVNGNFEKGYNQLNFRRDELGVPGVYYYELETAKNSDRKKMILID